MKGVLHLEKRLGVVCLAIIHLLIATLLLGFLYLNELEDHFFFNETSIIKIFIVIIIFINIIASTGLLNRRNGGWKLSIFFYGLAGFITVMSLINDLMLFSYNYRFFKSTFLSKGALLLLCGVAFSYLYSENTLKYFNISKKNKISQVLETINNTIKKWRLQILIAIHIILIFIAIGSIKSLVIPAFTHEISGIIYQSIDEENDKLSISEDGGLDFLDLMLDIEDYDIESDSNGYMYLSAKIALHSIIMVLNLIACLGLWFKKSWAWALSVLSFLTLSMNKLVVFIIMFSKYGIVYGMSIRDVFDLYLVPALFFTCIVVYLQKKEISQIFALERRRKIHYLVLCIFIGLLINSIELFSWALVH